MMVITLMTHTTKNIQNNIWKNDIMRLTAVGFRIQRAEKIGWIYNSWKKRHKNNIPDYLCAFVFFSVLQQRIYDVRFILHSDTRSECFLNGWNIYTLLNWALFLLLLAFKRAITAALRHIRHAAMAKYRTPNSKLLGFKISSFFFNRENIQIHEYRFIWSSVNMPVLTWNCVRNS